MKKERALTWSYGGGTQSVAIAVLIAQGRLPVPECIVIADVNKEASETWDYLRDHVQPLLATVGAKVEIAPFSLATVGLYSTKGDPLMPLYTASGKLPTFCSVEWKRRVVRRYLRGKGYGPEKPVNLWIGFSLDEVHRCKDSDKAWIQHSWPLLDFDGKLDGALRRHECRQLVLDHGLPEPPRSACYDCPFRSQAEWRQIKENYPLDWEKAVANDDEMRAKDLERGGTGVFCHRSLLPLALADLSEKAASPDQLLLEADCSAGGCWT